MSARAAVVLALLSLLTAACGGGELEPRHPGVFVLGFDGMEPTIVEAEMAAGRLPNFARLRDQGGYSHLGTSLPPESPVAWADFITGNDAGVHGIFDFVHRKIMRDGIRLYLGTADTVPPSNFKSILGYRIPFSSGGTKLLVKGKYFWEYLIEQGIPASVVRIPSNYPPKEVGARTFPGMGTPDVQGSYGVFSYYTDDPPYNAPRMRDAEVFAFELQDHRVDTVLKGPRNEYVNPGPGGRLPFCTVPLRIYVDPDRPVARIDVGAETRVLCEGEWSGWVPVEFPMIEGFVSVSGMVRLFLKQAHPHLRLYVSPVNADPLDPDIPLSTPDDACVELARAIGRYYTQGMAENTQALRYGVLDTDEFLAQVDLVLEERLRMLDFELDRFAKTGGMTFFYFSTTDLAGHMLFQYMDEDHPLYDPEVAPKYRNRLAEIYREMDRVLGEVLRRVPEGTRVVAMSDHGFKSYRRQINLNSWLREEGFLATLPSHAVARSRDYGTIDWPKTRAYSVGFSSIYLNLVGREGTGIVLPGERAERLKDRIIEKLEALRDPETGKRVVKKVYRREDVYHGPQVEYAPDLVVGFELYHGCSDESATGTVAKEVFRDTDDAWSGSHLMDPSVVPGILFVNTRITGESPRLYDLPVSILAEFGIVPEGMIGRRVW